MDISPSALTAALGAPVLSSDATLIGRFSCELWRLKLQLSDGTRTVVLKRPKKELGRNSLANERLFYERVGARVPHAPRYLGFVENEGALLLEHVPDLEPFDWRAGQTPDHANECIEAPAAMHRLDSAIAAALPSFDAARASASDRIRHRMDCTARHVV